MAHLNLHILECHYLKSNFVAQEDDACEKMDIISMSLASKLNKYFLPTRILIIIMKKKLSQCAPQPLICYYV